MPRFEPLSYHSPIKYCNDMDTRADQLWSSYLRNSVIIWLHQCC